MGKFCLSLRFLLLLLLLLADMDLAQFHGSPYFLNDSRQSPQYLGRGYDSVSLNASAFSIRFRPIWQRSKRELVRPLVICIATDLAFGPFSGKIDESARPSSHMPAVAFRCRGDGARVGTERGNAFPSFWFPNSVGDTGRSTRCYFFFPFSRGACFRKYSRNASSNSSASAVGTWDFRAVKNARFE